MGGVGGDEEGLEERVMRLALSERWSWPGETDARR